MFERDRRLDIPTIAMAGMFSVAMLGIVDSDLYIPPAMATPFGIINFEDVNPLIQAHEQAHMRHYQSGDLDFWKYLTNKNYRCAEEQKANLEAKIFPINDHPACYNK